MRRLPPGLCLTFDDRFVANWLAAQPLFAAHGAVATFCVSGLHLADADQIDGLRRLQALGHEIGYHSRTHPKLKPYLAEHGTARWVAEEIDAGLPEHRAAGFPATSFAAPFHASTFETRQATAARFEICRLGGPKGVSPDDLSTRIYQKPGRHKGVHNLGSIDFQHPVQRGWAWLEQLLDGIERHGGVGVFTGHDIREGSGKGFFATPDQIDRLLGEISKRGLRTYTLTEFARAAAVSDVV